MTDWPGQRLVGPLALSVGAVGAVQPNWVIMSVFDKPLQAVTVMVAVRVCVELLAAQLMLTKVVVLPDVGDIVIQEGIFWVFQLQLVVMVNVLESAADPKKYSVALRES